MESALVHGVFWADPSPDRHLLVAPGGRLVLAGVGACGHFTHGMRRAGIVFLRSVLGGDRRPGRPPEDRRLHRRARRRR
ncbi:MAG: hypothetical protein R2699_09135 [Acidimicrobiales bacterium]